MAAPHQCPESQANRAVIRSRTGNIRTRSRAETAGISIGYEVQPSFDAVVDNSWLKRLAKRTMASDLLT
jgi:hypothetical protein